MNPNKIKYVYISGPYRIGHPIEVVKRAVDAAAAVASLGYFPFIPHSITAHWEMRHDHGQDAWLGYCLAWVARCDALVRLPGESAGSDREMMEADKLNLPVFGDGENNGLEAFMQAHNNGQIGMIGDYHKP